MTRHNIVYAECDAVRCLKVTGQDQLCHEMERAQGMHPAGGLNGPCQTKKTTYAHRDRKKREAEDKASSCARARAQLHSQKSCTPGLGSARLNCKEMRSGRSLNLPRPIAADSARAGWLARCSTEGKPSKESLFVHGVLVYSPLLLVTLLRGMDASGRQNGLK